MRPVAPLELPTESTRAGCISANFVWLTINREQRKPWDLGERSLIDHHAHSDEAGIARVRYLLRHVGVQRSEDFMSNLPDSRFLSSIYLARTVLIDTLPAKIVAILQSFVIFI